MFTIEYLMTKTNSESGLKRRLSISSWNLWKKVCDDRFVRTIRSNIAGIENVLGSIKIMNPIDFLREKMKIDVIE